MSARGRGRGSAGVKLAVPNLALAGKRENASQNGHPVANKTRTARGHRGGRGGSGRGGGGGRGGRDRPVIIQSEGIFSEGLAAIEKSTSRADASFTRQAREEAVAIPVDASSAKTKFEGYDALWTVDPDEEAAELDEMLREGILSDYKKGSVLPVVLPRHDEIQFIDLLPKAVKEEFLSDGEDEREEALRELAADKMRQGKLQRLCLGKNIETTAETCSRKAAELLLKLKREGHAEMILFQLPTALGPLTQHLSSSEVKMDVVKQEPGLMSLSDPQPSTSVSSAEDQSHEPAKLPRGTRIGTLKVTRGGRVSLHVCGQQIDLTNTDSGSMLESLVAVETVSTSEPYFGNGFYGMSAAQRARENAARGLNALYYFGTVKHRLTASIDWDALRQASSSKDESVERSFRIDTGFSASDDPRFDGELVNLKAKASSLSERMKRAARKHAS